MPSLKVTIRSPSCKTLLDKDIEGGCFLMPGVGGTPLEGCPCCPQRLQTPLSLGTTGPEHTSEAQQEPELLKCSSCFAAAQQFVIKTQLAILIRLGI